MNHDERKIEQQIVAGLSRRHFLRASGTAALAALVGSEPRLYAGSTKMEARGVRGLAFGGSGFPFSKA